MQSPQAAAPQQKAEDPQRALERLQRQLKWTLPKARAAILWERTAPRLLPMAGLTAVFTATASAGAWAYLTPDLRMAGVGLFAAGLAACLAPLRHVRFPTRDEAIARIDALTGLPHNPVSTILGTPAKGRSAESTALWTLHQQETAARVGTFKAGKPQPDIAGHDPHKLRYFAAFALALGLAVGNVHTLDNLRQPFDWTTPEPPPPVVTPARVDVWVTPPQYTRMAPVFLTDDSVVRAETPLDSTLTAPVGSRVTVRVVGGDSTVTVEGGAVIEREPATPYVDPQSLPNPPRRVQPREYQIVLNDDAQLRIEAQGEIVMSWGFSITPDTAPTVEAQATMNEERPGTIDLTYTVRDDFGAVRMGTDIETAEPPRSQSVRPPRPLIEPPTLHLPPPR